MALEKLEIRVKGKDYVCLKPFPITLMQIEADCTKDDGTLNYLKWIESMLKLISKDIDIEDLVKYNDSEITLSNQSVLKPSQITYRQYYIDYDKLNNGIKDIRGVVNTYLRYCGVTGYDLDTLTYDDLVNIVRAYSEMFDESELTEVVEVFSTFR